MSKLSGHWANSEEILNKTEEWHLGAGEGLELHEYLGLTWSEYADMFLIPSTEKNNEH